MPVPWLSVVCMHTRTDSAYIGPPLHEPRSIAILSLTVPGTDTQEKKRVKSLGLWWFLGLYVLGVGLGWCIMYTGVLSTLGVCGTPCLLSLG